MVRSLSFPTPPEPFPQRSVPARERQAPCGGLVGDTGHLPTESPSQPLKKKLRFFHPVYSIAYLYKILYP